MLDDVGVEVVKEGGGGEWLISIDATLLIFGYLPGAYRHLLFSLTQDLANNLLAQALPITLFSSFSFDHIARLDDDKIMFSQNKGQDIFLYFPRYSQIRRISGDASSIVSAEKRVLIKLLPLKGVSKHLAACFFQTGEIVLLNTQTKEQYHLSKEAPLKSAFALSCGDLMSWHGSGETNIFKLTCKLWDIRALCGKKKQVLKASFDVQDDRIATEILAAEKNKDQMIFAYGKRLFIVDVKRGTLLLDHKDFIQEKHLHGSTIVALQAFYNQVVCMVSRFINMRRPYKQSYYRLTLDERIQIGKKQYSFSDDPDKTHTFDDQTVISVFPHSILIWTASKTKWSGQQWHVDCKDGEPILKKGKVNKSNTGVITGSVVFAKKLVLEVASNEEDCCRHLLFFSARTQEQARVHQQAVSDASHKTVFIPLAKQLFFYRTPEVAFVDPNCNVTSGCQLGWVDHQVSTVIH